MIMVKGDRIPELKEILGAMVFASTRPLTLKEMRKCLTDVAEEHGKEYAVFAEAGPKDIKGALEELQLELEKARVGFVLAEVAGGYRILSDASCGRWLKSLLDRGKPERLSHPALETLAIIAYRQPVTRSEIEVVRGVSVDHMIRTLMEMQLIRISGRSELPGRPFLYNTTHLFLEHFGLKSLNELSDLEPMLAARRELAAAESARAEAEPTEDGGEPDVDAEAGGEAEENDDV